MIEVNNLTRFKIDENRLIDLAEKVLEIEKKDCVELSVSIVGPLEIKRLNKKYRKIDCPTDVLSFVYKDSGEIILCPKMIKDNAKKIKEDFKTDLSRIFIHGILHVLGYDHEKNESQAKKMEGKTNYYLNLIK
jgi:probable rRNA maturation factor